MQSARESSKSFTRQPLYHRPSQRETRQRTRTINSSLEKTICKSRRRTKRPIELYYKTKFSELTTNTCCTRFTIARTTFSSKQPTRRSSRMLRIWTWEERVFNLHQINILMAVQMEIILLLYNIEWTTSSTEALKSLQIWPVRTLTTQTFLHTTPSSPSSASVAKNQLALAVWQRLLS